MSMVARTNPGPAEDDITDTDDGDNRTHTEYGHQRHTGGAL